MNDRTVRILELLAAKKSIRITFLAELLNVCLVTLRKDLDILEKRGIIRRMSGYVSLEGTDDTGKRIAIDHSIKIRIAKIAAEFVEEGETIMLESGSCCTLLAEELVRVKKNVSIITNSVFIANYISKLDNIKITLLGGVYQPESQVLVGPMTKAGAREIYSQKFFIGTDGFVPDYGFTGRDHFRVDTAIHMAERAKNVYILTEAAKFNRRGAYNLFQFDKLTGVFTDENIPKEAEEILLKNNVQLHKVPLTEERIKWCQFPGQPPFLYKERK